MGEFDFSQFQQIIDYLQQKIQAGGALSPEEQKVYDALIGFSNQGLNLTGTPDFNALYTAFNSLADSETKRQFAQLYGQNLFQDPNTGQIQFTRPGTVIEQFMRRGLSINDGPVMAALSEGLQNFLRVSADNAFKAMTNSYAAMTPIRAQNLQALQAAGQLGQGAANRIVQSAPTAVSAARGPAPGGEAGGAGEPVTIGGPGQGVNPNAGPATPSLLDRLLPGLLGLGGTALIAGLGPGFLKSLFGKGDNQAGQFSQEQLDRAAKDFVGQNKFAESPPAVAPSIGPDEWMNAQTYGTGGLGNPYPSYPSPDLSLASPDMSNPYQIPQPQDWTQSWQQNYDYTPQYDYSQFYQQPSYSYDYQPNNTEGWGNYYDSGSYDPWSGGGSQDQGFGGFDWGSQPSYDPYSWSGDTSGGYWV